MSFRQLAEALQAEEATRESFEKRTLGRKFRRLEKLLETADLSDPRHLAVFKNALQQLGASKDSRSAPLLCTFLDRLPVHLRTPVVETLGELENPAATGPLVRQLDEPDAGLRRAVVKALGKIGDRRAVRPLLELGSFEPHLKLLAGEAVVAMGEPAVPALLEALGAENPAVVLEAVVLLGRLHRSPGDDPGGACDTERPSAARKRVLTALVQIIETRSAVFRAHAAQALGAIGDSRAVGALCRLLADADAGVRVNAAAALAKIPEPAAVGPLLAALRDPDADVRMQAVVALGETGDRRACEPLRTLLHSGDEPLRIAVAEALGRLCDETAVQPLLGLLKHPNETAVLKAAGALKRLKDPQAVAALIDLLQHASPKVRQRAADSLGALGDAVAAEHLEVTLRNDRSAEVRMAAAKALGEIGDPGCVEALQDALRDELTVRCRAVAALGQIGDESSLPALLAMLKDPLPEVRYHAAGALAQLNHPNAITPLLKHPQEEHPLVRRGVEKALEKLTQAHGGRSAPARPHSIRARFSARKLAAALLPTWLALLVPQTTQGRRIAVSVLIAPALLLGVYSLAAALAPKDRVVPRGRVLSLAFAPDGNTLLAGRSFGMVEVWDAAGGNLKLSFDSPIGGVGHIAAGPDAESCLLASGKLAMLAIAGGGEFRDLAAHTFDIARVDATPDGTSIATQGDDGTIVVWDAAAGSRVATVGLSGKDWTCLALGPDAKVVAAGGRNGRVGVWSLRAELLHELNVGPQAVDAIAFSPDGRRLAAALAGQGILLWEIESKTLLATLKDELPGKYQFLKFIGGGDRLAAVRNGTGQMWTVAGGAPLQLPPCPAENVTACAVSRDGSRLALAGNENSEIWVYDLPAGTLQHTLDRR